MKLGQKKFVNFVSTVSGTHLLGLIRWTWKPGTWEKFWLPKVAEKYSCQMGRGIVRQIPRAGNHVAGDNIMITFIWNFTLMDEKSIEIRF